MHLLSQNNSFLLSKALVKYLGLLKAFALTDLVERRELFFKTNQLVDGEWFPYKREDMLREWGAHYQLQREILKDFSELGLIQFEKRGAVPQKNYYRLDLDKLDEVMKKAVEFYSELRKRKPEYPEQ